MGIDPEEDKYGYIDEVDAEGNAFSRKVDKAFLDLVSAERGVEEQFSLEVKADEGCLCVEQTDRENLSFRYPQ